MYTYQKNLGPFRLEEEIIQDTQSCIKDPDTYVKKPEG